ncbi:MAG: peptidyl-prolyl cis-trans isomerase [Candidatus Eisenbacteria sp.]|nr:peptidyl-prolyl cis-trans isomerase [Candidatus Eisenbacteria bacterium]
MKTAVFWAVLVLSALSLAGCDQEQDPVLITVGADAIWLSEFERAFHESVGEDGSSTPDSASARRFLNLYIDKTILEQIAADSVEWTPLREERAQTMLEGKMMRRMEQDAYQDVMEITDGELRDIYEEHIRTRYHYREMSFQDDEEARQILDVVRAGAVFEKVAMGRGLSQGGDQGWRSIDAAPAAVMRALADLGPLETSGLIRANGLYRFVQLIEKRPNPDPPPFRLVKDRFRQHIILERSGNRIVDFRKQLFEEYDFKTDIFQVHWMTDFLRKNTQHISRRFTPPPPGSESRRDAPPWPECPLPRGDWGRILATSKADTIVAILLLDHLMTKLVYTWPTFEDSADVLRLTRELMLDRIERQAVWDREYHLQPDFAYEDDKQRSLMLARTFHREFVSARARPTLEESRAWYQEHSAEFGEPEKRAFLLLHLRDWDTGLAAREILAGRGEANAALTQIRRLDPSADWVGTGQVVARGNQISSPLDRQIFRLETGEITEPVPYEGRFAIARLEKIEPGHVPIFEDIAEAVVERIAEARADSLFKHYIMERKAVTPIEVDEEVFRRMQFEPPPIARGAAAG